MSAKNQCESTLTCTGWRRTASFWTLLLSSISSIWWVSFPGTGRPHSPPLTYIHQPCADTTKTWALVGPARGLVLCAHCKGFGQKAVLLESSWRTESKSDAYWRRIQTHKLAPLSAASFHFCTDVNSMLGIAILAQVNSIVTQLGIFYKALQNREVFWPKLNKKPTHLNAV